MQTRQFKGEMRQAEKDITILVEFLNNIEHIAMQLAIDLCFLLSAYVVKLLFVMSRSKLMLFSNLVIKTNNA
jgi:hypothetical protein